MGNYIVKLVTVNSCGSDTIYKTIHVISVGNAPPLPPGLITVFPNPIRGDHFFASFEQEHLEEVALRLFDANGKMVYTESLGTVYGDLRHQVFLPDHFANGLYLLAIHTSKGRMTKRLILAK